MRLGAPWLYWRITCPEGSTILVDLWSLCGLAIIHTPGLPLPLASSLTFKAAVALRIATGGFPGALLARGLLWPVVTPSIDVQIRPCPLLARVVRSMGGLQRHGPELAPTIPDMYSPSAFRKKKRKGVIVYRAFCQHIRMRSDIIYTYYYILVGYGSAKHTIPQQQPRDTRSNFHILVGYQAQYLHA